MHSAVLWLWLLTPLRMVLGEDQRIFWVDDLISQDKVESKLWMMTGEDEPFGSRKIRYFDNDYCIEAFGSTTAYDCRPTWLINGWNTTDGTSLADRTQLSVAYDPAGQTIYNTAVDATHNLLYVVTSGGNSAGRSIIELPLSISGESMPYKACLQGFYSLHCPMYGKGERLVVGHEAAAYSVNGDGRSTNFASGTADRFPAWGTSQLAVLPASSPTTYPAKTLGSKVMA
eukprot:Skav225880  [mRNA]  locus=scaffold2702:8651:15317:- [translate_table: standard]